MGINDFRQMQVIHCKVHCIYDIVPECRIASGCFILVL